MPRVPMVTRTFKTTVVNALFANAETREMYENSFVIPHICKTEKEINKFIAKNAMFTGVERLVSINSFHTESKRFAMSENDFIANAKQFEENN